MRAPAADYLEEARIEELVTELSADGYRVERDATLGGQVFDLLAQRDGERVVYEVKARSRLKESIEEVARLREAAIGARVSGFQLEVVNPPQEKSVEIEGLAAELT